MSEFSQERIDAEIAALTAGMTAFMGSGRQLTFEDKRDMKKRGLLNDFGSLTTLGIDVRRALRLRWDAEAKQRAADIRKRTGE